MADGLVGTTLLGKLRVLRRVGEGAFGEVYEVEHTLTGHRRALKILRRDRATDLEAVTRFVREARVTSRLDSPHVAEVHDAGRLPDGRAYAVMDWLAGRSLRAVLEAEGRLAPARAIALTRQAAKGLAAVHAAGLLHRDIKPENLFVEDADGDEVLKLLDFGLVSDDVTAGDALTREGAILGSPAYMSARRLEGAPATARDDVHALGVVLYELLTGRRPFEAPTLAGVLAATHRGSFPSFDELGVDVPSSVAEVVARALGRGVALDTPHDLDRALEGAETSRIGESIDGFTVVRPIARGGMGEIFEVQSSEGERLAMKILRADRMTDETAIARMRREATSAARAASEHVVRVVQGGIDRRTGAPYLVMDLLEGEDLGAAMRRGPLETGRALDLLRAVARALDAVHAAGLVHRDVKPENVFVLPDGAGGRPTIKLLDFGIAALAETGGDAASLTTASTVVGTPLYLAPEQIDRSTAVGPAADRFALAQLAYALLVGEAYFRPEAARGLLAIMSALAQRPLEAPSIRAERVSRALPSGFDAWFARATALDPTKRFSTAKEQVEALASALDPRAPRPSRARSIAVACLVGALALGIAGWMSRSAVPARAVDEPIASAPAAAAEAAPMPIPAPPPEAASGAVPSGAGSAEPPARRAEVPRGPTPDRAPPPRPSAAPRTEIPDAAHDSPF